MQYASMLLGVGAANSNPDLIEKGNIDLYNRPVVKNPDGSISTVRSMSFGENGVEVLVPTVGDRGENFTADQAIKAYRQSGKHLGKFRSVEAANKYAEELHKQQEQIYRKK